MLEPLNRRTFLAAGAASLGATALGALPQKDVGPKRPIAIASANGLAAVTKAVELMKAGTDPLDAAIAGVAIVEADPN
jgi:N4-(beta-N-acetylglucosaminyl)-L-asparaginase